MTWFGTASAWAAAAVGALYAAYAALQFSWGDVPWVTILSAALLMMGAFRTLRKMSGGLRLLCGAWGLSAGLMMLPFLPADSSGGEGSYAIDAHWVAWLVLALPAISLAGLALTVLHKETK